MKKLGIFLRIAAIILGILGISLLHYATPLSKPVLHDIFQRLYYVPIILAAFWFGLKGGIGTALVVSILYAPHILFQWGGHPGMELDRYLEIIIFNLVGAVTGFLSSLENRQRRELEKTAAGLQESFETLRRQSDHILRIEEQLRQAERLSVIGELAAVLAHEVRNPLGSIKGAAEILRDDYKPGNRKYEFLEILLKESDRLNRVVEDFLGLSRPQPLNPSPCNIGAELRSLVMLVAAEAKVRGVQLELKADDNLEIEADVDKLHQAFLNVMMNGMQAVSAGESLVIEARQHVTSAAPEIRIDFRDSGPGIPEALRQKIFEPFFTTKQTGTGLGLAIARKIIEAHQGRIEVSENYPKGTVVTIFLPVVASAIK